MDQTNGGGVAIGFLLLFGLYFLPTLVAAIRRKRNFGAIFALNFFLGFTGIAWVVALIWALTKDAVQVVIVKESDKSA